MFQHILVPLDGSARAERALPLAARLARASGGKLILVRVVDIQYRIAWQAPDMSIDFDRLLIVEQEAAASYLAQIALSNELAGLNVLTETADGKPGEVILAIAQEQGADLILISSHGYHLKHVGPNLSTGAHFKRAPQFLWEIFPCTSKKFRCSFRQNKT